MRIRIAWVLLLPGSIVAACTYKLPTIDNSALCGNGDVDEDELCDDGNYDNDDGCDSNCTPTGCGNSIVTTGEACDDGNNDNGDDCTNGCLFTVCGDGFLKQDEECDDSNSVSGDGCDSNCTTSRCGNGALAPGETCDDGNTVNGDGCDPTCSHTNTTSIFVGTVGVSGNADGVGTAAQLSDRPFMTIHNGIMYFTSANTVRMADLATGTVTTIAGAGGTPGYVDTSPGVNARFGGLEGITTDGTTLWVSDPDNHVLRAISLVPPYAVSTVAGKWADINTNLTSMDGYGLAAQFDDLRGLHYFNGLIYMCDADAGIVQTFNPGTTEVKTIAGAAYNNTTPLDGNGTSAQFVGPRLMTSIGALFFITDFDGHHIRVFNAATNDVATVAGSTNCGQVDGTGAGALMYRPRGIATDGLNLFFSDPPAQTIRQINLATAEVTTLSGTAIDCATTCSCASTSMGSYAEGIGKDARWNAPWGMAFDPLSKSLFVADSGNFVIRRIQ